MTELRDTTHEPSIGQILATLGSEKPEGGGMLLRGVSEAEPFGDGHSGDTYLLALTDGTDGVLRLSGTRAKPGSADDASRQGVIMSHLHAAGLPVPEVVAHGWVTEPTGERRSYVVTRRVLGQPWEQAGLTHEELSTRATDFLTRLHQLPPTGLDVGSAWTFDSRGELDRWLPLFGRAPDALRARAHELHQALTERVPTHQPQVLTHGDLHYGNMLFADGQLVGVLDWEIAALSTSLVDVACLGIATLRRRYEPEPNPTGSITIPLRQLAAQCAVDEHTMEWAMASGCLKYSGILAYNLHLHRSGRRVDPVYELLQETMIGLVADGLEFIAGRWPTS